MQQQRDITPSATPRDKLVVTAVDAAGNRLAKEAKRFRIVE